MEVFNAKVNSEISKFDAINERYFYYQFNGFSGHIIKTSMVKALLHFFEEGDLYQIFHDAINDQKYTICSNDIFNFIFIDEYGYHGCKFEECSFKRLP